MSYRQFVAMMALIMAVSPFAVDAYVPAMPSMALFFGVGVEQIATTISCYTLGSAFGMLIGGPLSDRFGRKIMIIGGLLLFCTASWIISQTEVLLTVQISRVFQAMGSGFAGVCIPALVRERATGNEAAKIFSMIGLIMVGAPALAPSVGTLFITFFEWQSIFYFLIFYSLIVVLIASRAITADRPKEPQKISGWHRYREVLKNRSALRYAAIQASVFSIMLIFITNASMIYQDYYGVSEKMLAIILGLNVLMMAFFNRFNSRLLSKYPARQLLRIGLFYQLTSVFVAIILIALHAPIWAVAIALTSITSSCGGIMPNVNAIYISHYSEHTGSAAALAGAGQFLFASSSSSLSALLYNGTLWPAVLALLSVSVVGNLFANINRSPDPQPELG